MALGAGGEVWEADGVLASVISTVPDRSVFNSVFYEEGERLLEHLEEIAGAYEEAGVRAWTVWVPEADTEVAAALEQAGHVLDAKPRDMAMAIEELREPDPDPELEIVEREDYTAMARLNEAAYGYPEGDFGAVERATSAGLRIYFASIDGHELGTAAIDRNGDDALVSWVAVAPEGRGRGVSGRILAHALRDAGEQGMETTSLVATRLGYPVYEKLGYRDCGITQMWERRRPDGTEHDASEH